MQSARARLLERLGRPLGVPVAALALRAVRLGGRRAGVAIVLHRVGHEADDPRRTLLPAHPPALLESQLRHLAACYRVVPASELFAAVRARRRGERFPAAVTFDDDRASHRLCAMPVLQRVGLPATFFLCGATLTGPRAFWWEQLQAAVDRGADPVSFLPATRRPPRGVRGAEAIGAVAEAIKLTPPVQREEIADRLRARAGRDAGDSGLRAADARALGDAGFEIGAHTLRHDYLPLLDDEALARAMTEGRARLEEACGQRLRTIAYPFGGADDRVAAAARAAGYACGYVTDVRAVEADGDPLLMGRLEPSLASTGRFALQLVRTLLWRRDTSADG